MKAKEIHDQISFRPKIEKSSEILAQQRKEKVAQSLGLDKNDAKDKAKFLRAQGDHLAYKKNL